MGELIDRNWNPVKLLLAIFFITVIGLYWGTVDYLVGLWNQITSGKVTHGWVVVVLCLSMVWKDRHNLAAMTPVAEFRVILLVIVASGVWLAANLIDVRSGQPPAFLMVILTLIWTIVGSQIFRRLLFPLLFLSLSLPIWAALGPPLQQLTAAVTHAVIQLTGIPSLRDGILIELPTGIFEVSESCSGVNYLLAALTLSGYYAYTNYTRIRTRLSVVAIAGATAIFGNLLRVLIIVYIGHQTKMQSSLVNDHLTMGWILFGILMFILLWFDEWRSKKLVSDKSADEPRPLDSANRSVRTYPSIVLLPILIIAVSVGPALAYIVSNKQAEITHIELRLPNGVEGWKGPTVIDNRWKPLFIGASGSVTGRYQKHADSVSIYLGYYTSQGQERELINDLNNLAGSATWHIISSKKGLERGGMRELVLRSDSAKKALVWYRYEVGGIATTNRYLAKLLQLWGLARGRTDANVLAIFNQLDGGDPEISQIVLRNFVDEMVPLVERQVRPQS